MVASLIKFDPFYKTWLDHPGKFDIEKAAHFQIFSAFFPQVDYGPIHGRSTTLFDHWVKRAISRMLTVAVGSLLFFGLHGLERDSLVIAQSRSND